MENNNNTKCKQEMKMKASKAFYTQQARNNNQKHSHTTDIPADSGFGNTHPINYIFRLFRFSTLFPYYWPIVCCFPVVSPYFYPDFDHFI